jgi:hypothetical protein
MIEQHKAFFFFLFLGSVVAWHDEPMASLSSSNSETPTSVYAQIISAYRCLSVLLFFTPIA